MLTAPQYKSQVNNTQSRTGIRTPQIKPTTAISAPQVTPPVNQQQSFPQRNPPELFPQQRQHLNAYIPQQRVPESSTSLQASEAMIAGQNFGNALAQFIALYNRREDLKLNRKDSMELLNLNYEQQLVDLKIAGIQSGVSISEDSLNNKAVYENLKETLHRAEKRIEDKFASENFTSIIGQIIQGILTIGTGFIANKKLSNWLSKLGYTR